MVEENKNAQIEIFYAKNPTYRTVFADGAIGGVTPSSNFNLTFYATRNVIPKSVKHEISLDGQVNPIGKNSADSKSGILREIEVGVYMNQQTAKEIYEFLKKHFEKDVK